MKSNTNPRAKDQDEKMKARAESVEFRCEQCGRRSTPATSYLVISAVLAMLSLLDARVGLISKVLLLRSKMEYSFPATRK
jgi:hypothetical protein